MKKIAIWMEKSKFYPWELAIALGLSLTLFTTSHLDKEQENLAEGLIRLHVVANSDSDFDQALKLRVRDAVLEQAESIYQGGISSEEAVILFENQLKSLESAGESVSEGFEVTAEVTDLWFPTKYYQNFALPAGDYTALKITIGDGAGENWWCVAYPPLCLGAASETLEQAGENGNFTQKELDLITGDAYVFKFKSMEMLQNVKQYFVK